MDGTEITNQGRVTFFSLRYRYREHSIYIIVFYHFI